MEVEGQWWKDQLAADIHQALRVKELKLPAYRAHSPQISMRRYFADLLAMLSNRCQLCPTARHLAVYLLDLFMDHYDVAFKQLYAVALCCLLLASKFEEKEDRVPKLEQLNALGFMRSLNLVLNKQDVIRMELLLLETFGWNLCMPTAAHFIDYYLSVSVQEGDLHNGWPLCSLPKTRAFMDKYTHYFLEVSLQDHTFLNFRPSQVAAACVAASRICLQISPGWTAALHLLTGYTWDHLAQCVELMLIAHDSDLQEGNKAKSSPLLDQTTLQTRGQSVTHSSSLSSLDRQASTSSQHLLFHPGSYPCLSQPSATLSQLHMLSDTQALGPVVPQDYLQAHRGRLFSSSAVGSALHPYPDLGSGMHSLATQGSISMQVSLVTEPHHCLGVTYGAGYVSSHHSFTGSCFDKVT